MSGAWKTNDITIWKISGWWENDKQCRHCSGLRNNGWSVAGHDDDQPNDCSISLVIPTFRLNIARQNDQQGKDLTGQVLILMTGHYFLALNNIYIVYHCLHYLDMFAKFQQNQLKSSVPGPFWKRAAKNVKTHTFKISWVWSKSDQHGGNLDNIYFYRH